MESLDDHPPTTSSSPWSQLIKRRLVDRDRREVEPFKAIVEQNISLLSRISSLTHENYHLNHRCDQLLSQSSDIESSSPSMLTSGGVQQWQHKVFRLQEELTEVHRQRSQHAQTVIDLTEQAKEAAKQQQSAETKLVATERQLADALDECRLLTSRADDVDKSLQLMADEHQAVHLALSTAESNLKSVRSENERLLAELKAIKERDVQLLNCENDEISRKQQETVRQLLIDAVGDNVTRCDVENRPSSSPRPRPIGPIDSVSNSLSDLSATKSSFFVRDSNITTSVGSNSTLQIQSPTAQFEAHDGEINAILAQKTSVVAATVRLISAGSDRKIKIWPVIQQSSDVDGSCCPSPTLDCQRVTTLTGCNGAVTSLDTDDSGRYLVAGSSDFAVRLWSFSGNSDMYTSSIRMDLTLTGHSAKVDDVQLLPTSSSSPPMLIASTSRDRSVKIWNVQSRTCVHTLLPGSTVHCLRSVSNATGNHLSAAAASLVTGHFDRKIRFYDLRHLSSSSSSPSFSSSVFMSSLSLTSSVNYEPTLIVSAPGRVTDIRFGGDESNIYQMGVLSRDVDAFSIYDVRHLTDRPVMTTMLSDDGFESDAGGVVGWNVASDMARFRFLPSNQSKLVSFCDVGDKLRRQKQRRQMTPLAVHGGLLMPDNGRLSIGLSGRTVGPSSGRHLTMRSATVQPLQRQRPTSDCCRSELEFVTDLDVIDGGETNNDPPVIATGDRSGQIKLWPFQQIDVEYSPNG